MKPVAFQLAYTDQGMGDPLILLHGNGEDGGYFLAQTAILSQTRRVLVVDTRGHGRSPRGDGPFTLERFAEDLRDFLDCRGLREVDILGYSDGGNIALLFALRYPGRIRRLIVNGANLNPFGMKMGTWLATVLGYGCACAAAPFSRRAARRKELLGLMATEPHIRPEALRKLTMPALVIAGTQDLIRAGHTRLIARSLPHARLVWVEGGHAVARENPVPYNEAVWSFLSENG
ncbi:MAG: alpha/beta hydrolase [Clostridiales bacterium]|nr:alpha/beta hydrolase [Clostridiales bacterium]